MARGNSIGPTIGIEGEAQFRNQIKAITRELSLLRAEEKMVTSEFEANDKSAQKLSKQNEVLGKAIEAQQKKLKLLQEYLEKVKQETGENSAETSAYQQKVYQATTELNKLERAFEANARAIDEAGKEMDDAGDSMENMGEEGEKLSDSVQTLADSLMAQQLINGLKQLADMLWDCVDASMQFETAMAGVQRTTGLAGSDLTALGDSFKEMSTTMPITTGELAQIATTAGQLGIQSDKVEQFTQIMAQLATTTDLTADTAATMLAQFSNITGNQEFDRLGAVVASLGDATATTASKVVEMSQGMAAMASLAGMSETDIMAIAAAVGSLGIEAQAGSTSMSTLISTLYKAVETGDGLEAFAAVANMSAAEFRQAWGKNAVGALDAFIRGLTDTERNGRSAIAILGDLGITNVRQTKAILGLASAGDLLSNTIAQANTAWEENSALAEKAGIMYDTTEAKMTMLQNAANNLQVAIGDALSPTIGNLADRGTEILTAITDFVDEHPEIVKAITALAIALGVATGALAVTVIAIKAVEAAVASLESHPIVAAISAIIAVLITLVALMTSLAEETDLSQAKKETDELKESFDGLQASIEESKRSLEVEEREVMDLISRLRELDSTSNRTAAQKKEMAAIVDELNKLVPELALAYDQESDSLTGLVGDIDGYIEALYRQRLADETLEAAIQARRDLADAEATLAEQEEILAQKSQAVAAAQAEVDQALADLHEGSMGAALILDELNAELNQARIEEANYGLQVEETRGIVAGYQKTIDDLTSQVMALTDAQEDGNAAMAEVASIEAAAARLKELEAAYYEAYDAAMQSLEGQTGLFKKLDAEASISTDTLITNLQSQIEWLDKYEQNLQKLSNSGIPNVEILVRALSDGSTESAAALEGLANESEDKIREVIAAMQQVEENKGILADAIADEKTGYTKELSKIERETGYSINRIRNMGNTEARQAAVNVVQGLINGIDSRSSILYARMYQMGQRMIQHLNRGTDSNSPSKEAIKAAENVMDGLILGVKDAQKALDDLMIGVGEKIIAKMSAPLDKKKAALEKKIEEIEEAARKQQAESSRKSTEAEKKALENQKKVLQEQIKAIEEEAKAKADGIKAVVDEYEGYIKELADEINESLEAIEKDIEAVGKKREAMAERLAGYGDVLKETKISWSDGTNETRRELANLQEQIDALNQYGDALQALRERGIDEGLLMEIGAMGMDEGTAYAEELMKLTDAEFALYNRTWQEKQKAAAKIAEDFYKSQMDELEKSYAETLQAGLDDLEKAAYSNGEATVSGLIEGMKSREAELKAEAERMAKLVEDAMKTTLEISSPSRVMEELGGYTAEGFEIGFARRVPEIDRMMESAIPTQQAQTEAMVNAIGMLGDSAGAGVPAQITLVTPDGQTVARWLVPDIRNVDSAEPAIKNDF